MAARIAGVSQCISALLPRSRVTQQQQQQQPQQGSIVLFFAPSATYKRRNLFASVNQPWGRRWNPSRPLMVCYLTQEETKSPSSVGVVEQGFELDMLDVEMVKIVVEEEEEEKKRVKQRVAEKVERKKLERKTYLVAAVLSSLGITSMAIAAVYYRLAWQMEGGEVPVTEMLGTFALSVGAAVGMEFWARWAHRELWHASLWHMHESHHRPRDGPFELNDVFAITNAVPAISLLAYGFFNHGIFPGLCFGAGLGITMFGMAYMFVHDGLVHRRFPVGPIANVPYFRKVAAAHQIHHSEKFNGVPYGLFLGPKELEEVGGTEELEKVINRRIKAYDNNTKSDTWS